MNLMAFGRDLQTTLLVCIPHYLSSLSLYMTAQLLAKPVRTCALTRAHLPSSLLVKFNSLKTSQGTTLLPVSLYQKTRQTDDASVLLPGTRVSNGKSYVLRHPVISVLKKIEESESHSLNVGPQTAETVSHLLKKKVCSTLRSTLRRRPQDFTILPSGLDALQEPSHAMVAILYLGGSLRSDQLSEVEKQVMQSAVKIHQIITRFVQQFGTSTKWKSLLGEGGIIHAHPRSRFDTIRMPTIEYTPDHQGLEEADQMWVPAKYAVPILSLHDIVGETRVREMVQGTKFEDEKWLAVKFSRHTVAPLQWLLQGLFWFSEN
jgi:hypothetical protein